MLLIIPPFVQLKTCAKGSRAKLFDKDNKPQVQDRQYLKFHFYVYIYFFCFFYPSINVSC